MKECRSLELTGVDAIRFADSFFNPTVKQIEENRRRMEYIDSIIGIRETTGGFTATIQKCAVKNSNLEKYRSFQQQIKGS